MSLASYIGQRDALAPLTAALAAVRANGRPLPHSLFLGRPGTGKTTLARTIADELGVPCVVVNCASVADRTRLADAAIEAQGGILALDEIHALDRKAAESLFTLLDEGKVTTWLPQMREDFAPVWIDTRDQMPAQMHDLFYGPGLYEVPVTVATTKLAEATIDVADVVVIGCTTDEALMPPALLSRLSRLVVRLRDYTEVELATIATLYAEDELGCSIEGEAAIVIAQHSRRSPRRVKQLTERASDYAIVRDGRISVADAHSALSAAGIGALGLEAPHRELLGILAESGGLSRTSLAQRLALPPRNVTMIWSDLAAEGLVQIDTRHRITEAGMRVLG